MKQHCGCGSGVQVVTPQSETSRPGRSALSYRAGTYATFFESMVARLSSLYIDLPAAAAGGSIERIWPLKQFDNDPNFPENGRLTLDLRGGR